MGVKTTDSNTSIILYSARNIALRGDWIFLNADRLTCTVPAANQSGIYARFA
jgi:hypothetical protein